MTKLQIDLTDTQWDHLRQRALIHGCSPETLLVKYVQRIVEQDNGIDAMMALNRLANESKHKGDTES